MKAMVLLITICCLSFNVMACPQINGFYKCENSEDEFSFSYVTGEASYQYSINNEDFLTDGVLYEKNIGGILRVEYVAKCENKKLIIKKNNENVFEPGIIHTEDMAFYYGDKGQLIADLKISTNGQLRGEAIRNCYQ